MELRAEEDRLANADALHSAATVAHDALLGDPASGSYDLPDAVSLLGTASQALEAVASHDPALAGLAGRLSEASYLVCGRGRRAGLLPAVGGGRPGPAGLHVTDAAAAFVSLLQSEVEGPVNIASGKPTSIRKVLEEIGETNGPDGVAALRSAPVRSRSVPHLGECSPVERRGGLQSAIRSRRLDPGRPSSGGGIR